MQTLTAVVLGATGLIGEQLVQQLLNDAGFSKVRILVRRPVQLSHPKLDVQITDFTNLVDYRNKLGKGDCIFCCIGTTMKQVKGDKALYKTIDFDIPYHAAQIGKDEGFTSYILVSAVNANKSSGNFYLSLKGEVEDAIAKLNYKSFHAFRPSILLGERKELRVAERIGKGIMQALSFLFVGKIEKYKGIEAGDVAAAMITAAKDDKTGMLIHHYADIKNLAAKAE